MKLTIYILLIIALNVGCSKETFEINNLNGDKIHVLGHGGMGITNTYPINSLESLAACLSEGADGTEIDIQMTKDSVLVAFHDSDLSPSTNLSGTIHSMTWSELEQAHYTNVAYGNYNVIALSEFFNAIDDYSSKLFTFDIKLYPETGDHQAYYETYTDALIQLFDSYNLEQNVYIESQTTDFLNLLQSKKPTYQLYIYPQTFEEGLSKTLQNGYRGMSISSEAITAEQILEAHAQNVYVTIWGVDTRDENTAAIRKNPDMIQTDDVKYLVGLLND